MPALHLATGETCTIEKAPKGKVNIDEISDNVLASFDIVITNDATSTLSSRDAISHLVQIPTIHFGGFHPDVVYMRLKEDSSIPVFDTRNASASGLALFAFNHGFSIQKARELYTHEIYHKLKFLDYFDISCETLMQSFLTSGLKTDLLEKFLVGRDVFMHGPLHPKQPVVTSLVYALMEKEGMKPVVSMDSLNQILRDPKEYEYAWSCFPPMAKSLGIAGGWGVRLQNQFFLNIDSYLTHFYDFMENAPKAIEMAPADKERFEHFHCIYSLLGKNNANTL